MLFKAATLALALSLPLTVAAESVLGVYMFHRHGDRTDKTHGAKLTSLGYNQVFESGTYFRNKYISGSATAKINGIASDTVSLNQLYVSAPDDNVLMSSAQAFLQGLYPPLGSAGVQTLRNGTNVTAPLNGYQLIPVHLVSSGAALEDSTWLQGASGCGNAINSSQQFFSSPQYLQLQNSTMYFYKGLAPMVNTTFNDSQLSYKNAYAIFDVLNVASIDNKTFPSSNLYTPETQHQVQTLADSHELGLAYNMSSPVRAIAGAVLGAQILDAFNATISSKGKTPLNIQFGAYGTFFSFIGLSGLLNASSNFYGIPDYSSVMVFELYTDASASSWPATSDLRVRFSFRNGTTSTEEPTVFPLFSQSSMNLSWSDFSDSMSKFAVGSRDVWCRVCGNTTGTCANTATTTGSAAGSSATKASAAVGQMQSLSSAVLPLAFVVAIFAAVL